MASVNQSPTFLPNESPSGIGGNAATYQEKINGGAQRKEAQAQAQQRGGQGHGFEGKMIVPGVAEVSSYKGGSNKRRQSKRRQSKRRQSKKNQSKKNQSKKNQRK